MQISEAMHPLILPQKKPQIVLNRASKEFFYRWNKDWAESTQLILALAQLAELSMFYRLFE